MNQHLRRATLELAAGVLEELHGAALDALAGGAGRERVYTDERQRPMPEEGDELSGLARAAAIRGGQIPPADGITEQEGMTEEEYERARDLEEGP